MDERELVEWRRLRDAADANALAFVCGDDMLGTEAELLAVLADLPRWATGLVGMDAIHLQRARQSFDDDWREGHLGAAAGYRAELEATELAIRSLLSCLTHTDGVATATAIVATARIRGGRLGTDSIWLNRAFVDMQGVGEADGLRVICRELLLVAPREERSDREWLRLGFISPHELSESFMHALSAMWCVATTSGQRAEVLDQLERRAVAALKTGDFHDLYRVARAQQLVIGEPFAPWLQLLVEQGIADDLQRDLDQPNAAATRSDMRWR